MLKRITSLIYLFSLLGLLCSPSVFAQPRGEILEDVADEYTEELVDAQANSKKVLEEVGSLQEKFGKKSKDAQLNRAQMEKSLDVLYAHYSSMSEKEICDEIIQNMDSQAIKNLLIKFPKFNLFLARILKDREALKKVFALTGKTEELKKAGLWFLGTIIFGFFLNKLLFKRDHGILEKLRSVIIRFTILWGIRIWIIVHFYGENLGPAYKIFKKTFLKF